MNFIKISFVATFISFLLIVSSVATCQNLDPQEEKIHFSSHYTGAENNPALPRSAIIKNEHAQYLLACSYLKKYRDLNNFADLQKSCECLKRAVANGTRNTEQHNKSLDLLGQVIKMKRDYRRKNRILEHGIFQHICRWICRRHTS